MRRPAVLLAGVTGSIVADRLGVWWPATAALVAGIIAVTVIRYRRRAS